MRPSFVFAALICAPLLMSACKKKPVGPTDTDDSGLDTDAPPDPEVRLQVVSVDPSQLPPNAAEPMRVYGAGFEAGSTVAIGSTAVTGVRMDDTNTLGFTSPALAEGVFDVVVTNPDGRSATLRQGLRVTTAKDASCAQLAMYFDNDSSTLSDAARKALNGSLACLRTHNVIRLEGHADERGTTDYNVALGQRRAEAVASWLTGQGFPPSKLPMVSYGEERPMDKGHDEGAWAKNRRVDMVAQ